MKLEIDTDPTIFLDKVTPLLESREAENNLIIGLATKAARNGVKKPPQFLSIRENGQVKSCALQMPKGYNLVLTFATPAQLRLMADAVDDKIVGAIGPIDTVEAFVKIWCKKMNAKVKVGMDQLIYRLDSVLIKPADGELVLATQEHFDLLFNWTRDFGIESLPHEVRTDEEYKANTEYRIQHKEAYFWKVNGELVSLAALNRETPNGICVSLVYTPPKLRGKGHASSSVAALSKFAMNRGKTFCCLYTDRANPTSNKIYQRIGYNPVCESRHYLFEY